MPTPAYASDAKAVLASLESDASRGLTDAVVEQRRKESGWNELREAPPVSRWWKLAAQFNELVIWILLVAAVIAGISGDWIDTVAIMAIVILNGLLGFFQEERAEQALAELRKLSSPMARVHRNGSVQMVPARDLVAGDRISLEAGDQVPADARLISEYGLEVQEAALTGESHPVEKEAEPALPDPTPIAERKNMVFMSTVVTAGKGEAVVVSIGMETELGRIAGMLQEHKADPTPLQKRLAELGRILVWLCLGVVTAIFLLELYRGGGLMAMIRSGKLIELILSSVSLAVAAVPEGLPAIVTLALALGLQRMVKRNVLIRHLPSVETLGSVTVICSDKTGTLTRNEMTVRSVVTNGQWYRVTGAGYAPEGEFLPGREVEGADAPANKAAASKESGSGKLPEDLMRALTIGGRCNNARLQKQEDGTGWKMIGDPTEGALLVAALKAGIEIPETEEFVVSELPFDSDRKVMSVVIREDDGTHTLMTKGAPEVVLGRCETELRDGKVQPLTDERRKEIQKDNMDLAAQALRVLGLAYQPNPEPKDGTYLEEKLTFAGLAGLLDPPREEVKAAIARCREAGIQPVMITGDHPVTAAAIAKELQLTADKDRTVAGHEFDGWSPEELANQVPEISVYARVSPEHKLRVVQAWKSRGDVVAMTGDGVNDAPAVKAASIGIAMGITGTDVTKQASHMVLTDDNFTSIVNAVEEGRGIFDNIQKVIHYLLSCNLGEVLLMLIAAVCGWPAPLVPIHLLWINLVTDGMPALALGMEPTEADAMRRPPRPPQEAVITLPTGALIAAHGILIALVAVAGFYIEYKSADALRAANPEVTEEALKVLVEDSLTRARTVTFCIMAFSQLFFAVACRSHGRTMPQIGLFSNPQLLGAMAISIVLQLCAVLLPFTHHVFETTRELHWQDGALILALALVPVTVIELVKLARAAVARRD